MSVGILVAGVSGNASTKDAIISLLSRRFPLSVKEVSHALGHELGISVSYQAVHKAVLELFEQNVLEKAGLKYRLAPDWISRIKNFADQVEKLYSKKNDLSDFSRTDIVNFRFSNFIECGKFLINDFYLKFPNPENKEEVSFNEHCWLLIGGSDREFEALKEICKRKNIYNITLNDTVLDRQATGFLISLGKKCLVGIKPPMEGDLFIVGDFIAQVYYSSDFKKEFYGFYEQTKDFSKFNLPDYFRVISKESFITVTISRNADLADFLRKQAKEIFEKNHLQWT